MTENYNFPLAKKEFVVYNGCCSHSVRVTSTHPPVAKLDIAVDSDSKGRGFESLRAGQKKQGTPIGVPCFFCFTLIFEPPAIP